MPPPPAKVVAMRKGFTLAELLIALAILGVIATFTIQKVLVAQSDAKYKAIAKEAAAMVSGAYEQYKNAGLADSNTSFQDLLPYMNYVSLDTSTPIDGYPGWGSWGCDSSINCIVLHNGARIGFYGGGAEPFSGTGNNNAFQFIVDPDGRYSGTTNNDPTIKPVS
jgi:prepilin-type N-terminal cleavage/methylation domain-containing protein